MATTWQPAVIIRFTGPRFDDAAPTDFDVAAELSAVKSVILKVAEALWRGRSSPRARLPKGFGEGALLRFRELRRGGVMTVLERGRESTGQLSMDLPGASGEDDIERAVKLTIAAVRAASRVEPPPAAFPKDALPAFRALGKGLGDDERCELHEPGSLDEPASFSQAERVVLARLIEGDGLDIAAEVGYVPAIGRRSFELFNDLEGGHGVEVPLSDLYAPVVVAASREYARVLVRGLGVFDEVGRLMRFVEVDSIEAVDNLPSWGGGLGALEGLPSLSKCGPEEPGWAERLEGSFDLNAYIYGIGR